MAKPSSDNPITFFARTDFRDHRKIFGIRQADRRAHMYLIGKTGTGKSTLLETLIAQDVRDGQGMYHRYGAHIVGSRVFASNLVFARHWVVRTWEPALQEGALLAAEQRYVESNPHEALLRPIFTMAGIEYGRMDYAVVDGRIQIFEINTNPVAPAGAHLLAGAREIDCELDATRRIPVTARFKPAWREDLSSAHWVSRGVHAVLYRLDLLGIERRVQSALRGTKRRLAAMAKGLLT